MNTAIKNKIRLAAALALLTPSLAFATNGYFSHGWGMKSKALAGAGIANAEDGMAGANNPAAMVVAGNRVDFGLDLFSPDRESTVSGNGGGGNQTADGNGDDMFLIPEFGYNQMMGSNRSFGVVVYGNGGMNTSYDGGIILFNGAAGPNRTGVDLSQLFIAPTYSMKFGGGNHSFGVSLNLAYQRFQAEGLQNFCNAMFSSNPTNCTNNGYSTSTGYGATLGYLGQLTPTFALGVTYRSQTYMSEFDEYAGLFAEQGDFDIPSMYGIGMKFTPNSNLAILFDYTHINYSDIAAISNPLLPNFGIAQLGADNGAGFGWEDMDVYKLAVSWQVNSDLTLLAGWNHGDQPIPASETLFNILAPATVEDHLTLGATWAVGTNADLTVAYMHAFENDVNGQNSIPASFGSGEADLKMSQDSIGVAYGWKF